MDIRHGLRGAYDNRVQALLTQLGLEEKRSALEVVSSAIGLFGAGIAVGAALGVAFAPKRGEELRDDVRHRIDDLKDRSRTRYEELMHREYDSADDSDGGEPHAHA